MTSEHPLQTGAGLNETIRQLLPHGSFELAATRSYELRRPDSNTPDGVQALVIRCRCGRRLDWPAGIHQTLPMDILLYWLADHDDDMFLTAAELEAKHTATMPGSAASRLAAFAQVDIAEARRALAMPGSAECARDILPSPYENARDSAWDAVNSDYDEARTNATQAAYDINGDTP